MCKHVECIDDADQSKLCITRCCPDGM